MQEMVTVIYEINFEGLATVLSDPSISPSAKALLCLLLTKYARTNNSAFPTQETLAKDLNRTTKQIRNLLVELKLKNLIYYKQRGFNSSNQYYFSKEIYFPSSRKKNSDSVRNKLPINADNRFPPKVINESKQNKVSSNNNYYGSTKPVKQDCRLCNNKRMTVNEETRTIEKCVCETKFESDLHEWQKENRYAQV